MPDYAYDLPDNFYYGGGGGTFAPPLAVALLVVAILLVAFLPRKYVIVPFLIAALWIPGNVALVVLGLHFNVNRMLLLAGWARVLARGECCPDALNSLDKAVIFSALVNVVAYVLLWRQVGALINRGGFLFSALGTYLLLRSWIREKEDVVLVSKVIAIVVLVVGPLMLREHLTQYNAFSWVGAAALSMFRNQSVRAQGPFAHSIIAGTFGAVSVPLFVSILWYKSRARLLAVGAIASSLAMIVSSSSSTPLMSFGAGILALLLWPLRNKMRMVRRGIVFILIVVQLAMKSPIWFVINRVGGVLGGSGWHRSTLIDNFVRHFFDWFLIGTRDNANWGWSMWDVDNAFVGAGLMGGLLGFMLFISVFVRAYKMIGVARKAAEASRKDARLIWAIGAALFANTIAFFGIVYFDQSVITWYALLVMISVIAACPIRERSEDLSSQLTGTPVIPSAG